MMSGSLSTTVARRTEFFGLLRCLGATPAQVRRFVVQEALSWCLTAVPAGLAASAVTVWALCALLRGLTPTWFAAIPVFGISVPGLLAGAVIGILTVLIAARTPSRRAARVSPLAAVSGGAGTVFEARGAADTRLFPVETALGIHHAVGDRKNLLLLTGSFAISIVLFLSFSLGISFLHHALRAMQPWTPDVSVVSSSLTCEIPDTLREQLSSHPAVKRIFGRGFAYDIPAVLGGQSGRVTLLSYEEHQFGWAEKQLRAGSMDEARSGTGVLVYGAEDLDLNPGDILSLETSRGSREVPVAGILSYLPFDRGDNLALIVASEDLFESLTGESGSTILDLQLSDQSDEAVQELRDITGDAYTFSDSRASNTEIRAVYLSAALFVYGFLAVITLIAALSEINSIRMSVHARIRQYGAMRAVGMELRQLRVMVSAETLTGLLLGLTVGLAAGFPLHWLLHMKLITARWGDPWAFPLMEFSVIGLVMLLSAILAITGPVREIGRQSVVDTIRSA